VQHGVHEDLCPCVVAGEQGPWPEHLGGEATENLGEPVQGVEMAGAVLGITVERKIGKDHTEAVGQLLDGRLPLLVGEQSGVQQGEGGPGAELSVCDTGAVVVVV
jgi:hypothetical protein